MLLNIKQISYFLKRVMLLAGLLLMLAGPIQAADDVIGIKVFEAGGDFTNYPRSYTNGIVSPDQWYQVNVPNPGNPQSVSIDGYPAIVDGRTTYVAATNQDGDRIYNYIFLISINEGASENSIEIVRQLISNWVFNVDFESDEDKTAIQRDLQRVLNINNLRGVLEKYRSTKGQYPLLEAGTYVPNTTYSTWPSWQETLGAELGGNVVDPINRLQGCAGISDNIDPNTCWDESERLFYCPQKAEVFAYKSLLNGDKYALYTNYEFDQPGTWQDPSETELFGCLEYETFSDKNDDDLDGIPNQFDICPNGESYEDLDSCPRYRFISFNELEAGEGCRTVPGMSGYCYQLRADGWCDTDADVIGDACDVCPDDPLNDIDQDGICAGLLYRDVKDGGQDNCPSLPNPSQTNSDSAYEIDNNLVARGDVCDPVTCGNNIIEGFEQCDLGDNNTSTACNTTYNNSCQYCDLSCQLQRVVGGWCGDSTIQIGPEKCEYLEDQSILTEAGTVFNPSPVNSKTAETQYYCNKDCQWDGGWCGDGKVQSQYGENCELFEGKVYGPGNVEISASELGITENTKYSCNSDCQWDGGWCGDGIVQNNENCDEGSLNGLPNHCDSICSRQEIIYSQINWNDGNTTLNSTTINNGSLELALGVRTPYLWIPNSQQIPEGQLDAIANNKVMRVRLPGPNINAAGDFTMLDLGNCQDPSRTTVDPNGNLYVACRGNNKFSKINADTGNVIKTCDTGLTPRGITIDIAGDVWVANSDSANIMRFAGDDLSCNPIEVLPLNSTSLINVEPYGLTADSLGNIWIANRSYHSIFKINIDRTASSRAQEIILPDTAVNPYGIATDKNDNIWVAILEGKMVVKVNNDNSLGAMIDLQPYYTDLGLGEASAWAIASDSANDIWVTHATLNTVTRLSNDGDIKAYYETGNYPIGLSADANKQMWVVNYLGEGPNRVTPEVDGATVTVFPIENVDQTRTYNIGELPYAYSDMTGYTLASMIKRNASWRKIIDAEKPNVDWKQILWGREFPLLAEAKVSARMRVADTRDDLLSAVWTPWFESAPILLDNLETQYNFDNHQFMEIDLRLFSTSDFVTPTVNQVKIEFE